MCYYGNWKTRETKDARFCGIFSRAFVVVTYPRVVSYPLRATRTYRNGIVFVMVRFSFGKKKKNGARIRFRVTRFIRGTMGTRVGPVRQPARFGGSLSRYNNVLSFVNYHTVPAKCDRPDVYRTSQQRRVRRRDNGR